MSVNRCFKEFICVAFLIICITTGIGCGSKNDEISKPLQKITVGSGPAIVEVLTHVANDKGFFKENSLDATVQINPDGKTALQNLFDGNADIIQVMATPVVYASFKRNDFFILGKIRHSKIHFAVARADRGIRNASDLRGKRLAVTKGTSAEFFMDSFLVYNDINPSELDIYHMGAVEMVEAIDNGKVDAMFCWSPFPLIAQKRLGPNGLVLPSRSIVPASWLIIAKKDFTKQNFDIVKKYLQSLYRAEQFVAANREEAVRIHSKAGGVALPVVSELFQKMTLELALDQALLDDLEDQARWIIRYQYTDQTRVPNFLEAVFEKALKEVKPSAVTIIK